MTGDEDSGTLKMLHENSETFMQDTMYHEFRTILQQVRMVKKMTQAQLTTNIRKSAINSEYVSGNAILNDTIFTATDLAKFPLTWAANISGRINDGRKLTTTTAMTLRTSRVQSKRERETVVHNSHNSDFVGIVKMWRESKRKHGST